MDDFKNFDIRSWVTHGLTRHIAAISSVPRPRPTRAPLMASLSLSAFAVAASLAPVLSVSSTPIDSVVVAESEVSSYSAASMTSGVDLPFPDSSPSGTFTATANRLLDALAAGSTDVFDQQTLAVAGATAARPVVVLSNSDEGWATRVGNMLGDIAD